MTRQYFIIITLCLIMSACVSELSEQKIIDRQQTVDEIMEEHNQKLATINYKQHRLNIKEYQDGSYFRSDCNPQKYYSAYPDLKDWRKIDQELMRIYHTHQDKDYFHGVAQNIAGRFLRQKLFLLKSNPEIRQKVAFYLDLLVSNESAEWEIMSQAVHSLQQTNRKEAGKYTSAIDKYKRYILASAPAKIKQIDTIMADLEKQVKAKNAQANIYDSPLYNLKKVEKEEAKAAILFAKTL